MKAMTCRQLGGACDQAFHVNTSEQMAELSKQHAMEMMQKKDPAHLEAMQKMRALMKNPADMKQWFDARRMEFDSLPED